MSNNELVEIEDIIDDTSGFLIKSSTLKYIIEKVINEDRAKRSILNKIKQFFGF